MWAVQGILAALLEHQHRGQRVECSLLETAIGFSSWTSVGWLADGQEPTRQARGTARMCRISASPPPTATS
jgi:crotonobetainyl-CoA:carnitine CoA-transferase CaiB-like acyl-CoA transferase